MSEIDPEKLREALDGQYVAVQGGVGCRTTVTVYLDDWDVVCRASRAHLSTLPKTKEVEVWRIEMARWDKIASPQWSAEIMNFDTEGAARECERNLRSGDTHNREYTRFDCIRVTGPHKQRVPA